MFTHHRIFFYNGIALASHKAHMIFFLQNLFDVELTDTSNT